MNRLRKKGMCIEYHRLKYGFTINEILGKNVKICDYKTYQKVIVGECVYEEIYDSLLLSNDIYFKMDEEITDLCCEVINTLYNEVNNFDIMESDFKNQDKFEKINSYPYLIIKDFINDYRMFHTKRMQIALSKIKLYKPCLQLFPYKLKVIFYEFQYRMIYRTTLDAQEIVNATLSIPEEFHSENVILQILMDSEKFQLNLDKSIEYARQLEKNCLATNNLNMLMTVYQTYHGIYNYRKEFQKAKYYIDKMYTIAIKESVSQSIQERIFQYIGTNAFDMYDLKIAKKVITILVEKDPEKFRNLLLIYLYLDDFSDLELSNKILDIFQTNNERSNIEAIYFRKKLQGASRNKLKEYILNRIFPVLSKGVVHECQIFLDEIYKLGYYAEYKKMWEELSAEGFDLSECWNH